MEKKSNRHFAVPMRLYVLSCCFQSPDSEDEPPPHFFLGAQTGKLEQTKIKKTLGIE